LEINQQLKVALAAGKKNNVFIYQALNANAEVNKPPEDLSGPAQMLYAICAELLDQGITWKEWGKLSRVIMLRVALDKGKNKAAAARMLGLFKSYVTKLTKQQNEIPLP